MFKNVLKGLAMGCLGLCSPACGPTAQQQDYDFPVVPPICIVEDDPKVSVFLRKDLQPIQIDKMLIIPLYKDYRYEGKTENLAIAHTFIHQQGEDLEKKLASFDQRENLRRLVFWVPGYFPDSIGRIFPKVGVFAKVDGKKMIVLELQRCLGTEQGQINAAMKTLLEGDFVIEKRISPKPPPYADEPTMTNEPYDFPRLVRSTGYAGRFFFQGSACNTHVLWAFDPGTRIANCLSSEEKKTASAFTLAGKGIKETKTGKKNGTHPELTKPGKAM